MELLGTDKKLKNSNLWWRIIIGNGPDATTLSDCEIAGKAAADRLVADIKRFFAECAKQNEQPD